MSYSVRGTQYVLIPVGAGGGLQYQYPELHSASQSQGPTRLLAFTLEGRADGLEQSRSYPPLPLQPKLEASGETIQHGASLYAGYCKFCHGANGVARYGGSVPDLRYASAEIYAGWDAIVIGGSMRMNGMPGVEISVEDSDAIRSYLLSLAEEIRSAQ